MMLRVLLTLIAPAFAAAPIASDPLFDLMRGDWVGRGERVQLASGRRTEIRTCVHATEAGGRLVSANEIHESGVEGPRDYFRRYWVRPAAAAGTYELGAGDEVASRGRLEGDLFTVIQTVGDWTVRTETRFTGEGGSDLREVFADGHGPVTETRLHYRREPCPEN